MADGIARLQGHACPPDPEFAGQIVRYKGVPVQAFVYRIPLDLRAVLDHAMIQTVLLRIPRSVGEQISQLGDGFPDPHPRRQGDDRLGRYCADVNCACWSCGSPSAELWPGLNQAASASAQAIERSHWNRSARAMPTGVNEQFSNVLV